MTCYLHISVISQFSLRMLQCDFRVPTLYLANYYFQFYRLCFTDTEALSHMNFVNSCVYQHTHDRVRSLSQGNSCYMFNFWSSGIRVICNCAVLLVCIFLLQLTTLFHNSLELHGTKEFTDLQSLNLTLFICFGHMWSQTGQGIWVISED